MVLLDRLDPPPAGWSVTPYPSTTALAHEVLVVGFQRDQLEGRRERARHLLEEMISREEGRKLHTTDNLARAGEASQWERLGNLLKVNLKLVRPFKDHAEVIDHSAPGSPPVRIPLKPNLSPWQNLERYFNKAKKLKRSLPALECRLREHDETLSLLRGLASALDAAGDREELEAVEERLRTLGRVTRDRDPTRGRERPLEFVSTDGYRILVGRNNHENDLLSRKMAKGHDLWLHAKDVAGAHVIVRMRNKNDECPPGTLQEAAQLAAHYSKARYSSKVEIMWTRACNLKKPKGSAPGEVAVDRYRSMVVRPDQGLPVRLSRPV
ncbi:MAG: DUF814 domain-containing protein [Candidatus Riflebacteria bacterium]|nr:DUF814 domain-containing protein [Candidatus Riflebacteria bacterium]